MENDKVFNVPAFQLDENIFAADNSCEEHHELPAEDYEEPCEYNCGTVQDFINLTDDMMEDIISLEEELVRWRQALIKYLPKEWAEGLRQDIFNNMARGYAGDPAYDLYVQARGLDPQQSWEHAEYMQRLADGTDETSITYL